MVLDATSLRRLPAHQYYYLRVQEGAPPASPRFDVTDLSAVSSHIDSFVEKFPRVHPAYSVDIQKSADASLISSLHDESRCMLNLSSIDAVRLAAERIGGNLSDSDCCFSSPVKTRRNIMEAVSLGINRMAVSYPCEVMRISSVRKAVELVLLIPASTEEEDQHTNNKWRELLSVAKAKGMKVVGIAIPSKWDEVVTPTQDRSSMCAAALTRAREAYELAKECGHEISLVDLGNLIARNGNSYLHHQPSHHLCSTIFEEICDDDSDVCPTEQTAEEVLDEGLAVAFINDLLDHHFPQSLGIRILAQHAQYLVPDEALLKKWWSIPKIKRPAPSLHTYLTNGCSSNAAYICDYRTKLKRTPQSIISEMALAAPQA